MTDVAAQVFRSAGRNSWRSLREKFKPHMVRFTEAATPGRCRRRLQVRLHRNYRHLPADKAAGPPVSRPRPISDEEIISHRPASSSVERMYNAPPGFSRKDDCLPRVLKTPGRLRQPGGDRKVRRIRPASPAGAYDHRPGHTMLDEYDALRTGRRTAYPMPPG